ncbi:MAG: DUF371 domain-containing protein [Methanoregula sp.]|nr:DUF371 domain-containing protein [Methanoregula sp.]
MIITETIRCRGHPLVLGTHPTTFEVTMEDQLTETGNCIIGIAADTGCAGLSPEFKRALARDGAVLRTTLGCDGIRTVIGSKGSSKMTLEHPTDLVWRRSQFVCGRTIGILSDTVSRTLPRSLIAKLAEGCPMVVTLEVTRPD